jgi:hypothetical protein
MTRPRDDPHLLARSVAGSIVLSSDRFAREASAEYWELSRRAHRDVVEAVLATGEASILDLARPLTRSPGNVALYHRLVAVLAAALASQDDRFEALRDLAWRAECSSRLDLHVGARARTDAAPVSWLDLARVGAGLRVRAGDHVEVGVVIPFRDRGEPPERTRNLLACLIALNQQSLPRRRYHLTVVEADDQPRRRDAILPLVDDYLFAPCPGPFNRSWAVNLGSLRSAAELLCLLDADILVDADFLERNVDRFEQPGTQAHWPFRDVLCLDAPSSHAAIRSRCLAGDPAVDRDQLRGVHLRRPPGACIWVRASLFRRIGGMDERFEGRGGEDLDFAFRVERSAPLDRHADEILHLDHPRPGMRTEAGEPFDQRVGWATWPATSAIGRLDRYAV